MDTSSIENYESMTPEEKVAALEALEVPDNSSEITKLKNALSKANSEAAEWKRKHNGLLSEEEQKAQKDAEERQKLLDRVAELEAKEKTQTYKASYLAMGYTEEYANAAAEALLKGEVDKVFEIQKQFLTEHDKAYKAELMKGSAKPDSGATGAPALTREAYAKLSAQEKAELYRQNPDQILELLKGD